jgi:hypothetical protein
VYGWQECAMLSKCANPDCSEIFRYLHQGKIFCLAPTPEVEAVSGEMLPALQERFWLCDECSKKMTAVWGGTQVKARAPARPKRGGSGCVERRAKSMAKEPASTGGLCQS